MKLLIIDDDDYKIKKINSCLSKEILHIAKAYVPAMRKITTDCYDGIILDMGFPNFEDGRNLKQDKGLQVLAEMKRKQINVPVFVFSSNRFDVSEYDNVWDYVSPESGDLRERLEHFVNALINQQEKNKIL